MQTGWSLINNKTLIAQIKADAYINYVDLLPDRSHGAQIMAKYCLAYHGFLIFIHLGSDQKVSYMGIV